MGPEGREGGGRGIWKMKGRTLHGTPFRDLFLVTSTLYMCAEGPRRWDGLGKSDGAELTKAKKLTATNGRAGPNGAERGRPAKGHFKR